VAPNHSRLFWTVPPEKAARQNKGENVLGINIVVFPAKCKRIFATAHLFALMRSAPAYFFGASCRVFFAGCDGQRTQS
jgi:hypothetical protein